MIVEHAYQKQTTGWYCGPASTRVALSAGGVLLSQDQIAKELGTTTEGTASIHDVTRVLDAHLGAGAYADVILPANISQQDVDTLFARVKSTVDGGGVIVVNGAGQLGAYSYPGGHYVAVSGYDATRVWVSDVAAGEYWVTASAVAHWAAAGGYRGYAYKVEEEMAAVIRTTNNHGDDVFIDPVSHTRCTIPKGDAQPLENKLSAYAICGVEVKDGKANGWAGGYDLDPANSVWAGVDAAAAAGPVDIDALAAAVVAKLGDSIAEQVAAKLAARLAE